MGTVTVVRMLVIDAGAAKGDEPGKQAGLKDELPNRPQAPSAPVKRDWKTYPVLPLRKSRPR